MPDSDTSISLEGLKTDLPLALFPVRLETRFTADGNELLVRVYPDAVHVDSFESGLTEVEITWGKHFWEQTWLAGKNEARERSAWAQLAEQFGPARAAWIANALTPTNPGDQPPEPPPPNDKLSVAPQFPNPEIHREAWTRAPHTQILPERWVALGYQGGGRVFAHEGKPIRQPLAVGPSPDKGLHADSLKDDPEIGWLVDFAKAEKIGMGLRIPYSVAPGHKLDRLMVVGVNATLTGDEGQKRLNDLLRAHHHTQGLAFIAQGTPSNDTDDAPSGYSTWDPGFERSYRVERTPADLTEQSNGAVTARALGIDESAFHHVREAAALEQLDAQRMNTALWQATWGYFLEQMMAGPGAPSEVLIRQGRGHFERYVRARGSLPALRIGTQPYGLLPVISLERWQPLEDHLTVDAALVDFLRKLRDVWRRSLALVPRVPGSSGDPETLLQVLAMTPTSVAYFKRPAQRVALVSSPPGPHAPVSGSQTSKSLAETLGLTWTPRQIRMMHGTDTRVSPWTGDIAVPGQSESCKTYCEWLATAPYEEIRSRKLESTSDSLLFWLLREACLREYLAAAFRILHRRGLATPEERLEREWEDEQTPTPFSLLTRAVAGLSPPRIEEYLDSLKKELKNCSFDVKAAAIEGVPVPGDIAEELGEFASFFESLDALAGQPPTVLEGLLRETLDLCSHRYDAWVTSFAAQRLDHLRKKSPQGIYLGGYGWVENLKRSERQKVQPPAGGTMVPLYASQDNQGFVHAPSLAHATTAALLRSGYLSRRAAGDQNALAVNLSSERVRLALWLLDGVRQGQPLSALLGYRFERGLHENHPGLILDQYIPVFRRIAPLEIKAPTAPELTEEWSKEVESLPANNVVDGLALLQKFKAPTGEARIPWGIGKLPAEGEDNYKACIAELKELEDAVDAISDLVIAESVHHVAQGNPMRAGATLEAIAEGEAPPPELEVIRTPRTGIAITHRIAVVFSEPPSTPVWGAETPRASAEPFLNAWAAQLLGPAASDATCRVEYRDRATGDVLGQKEVSLDDLGLAPIDLLYLPEAEGEAQRAELEQRVIYAALRSIPDGVSADADVRLTFARDPAWPTDRLSFAEVLEAARTARRLVTAARTLNARDLALPDQKMLTEAEEPDDCPLALGQRAAAAVDSLKKAHDDLKEALDNDLLDLEAVRNCLMRMANFGLIGAVPLTPIGDTAKIQAALRAQAESIQRAAAERIGRIELLDEDYERLNVANPHPAETNPAETNPAETNPAETNPAETTRDYHLARLREVFGPEFQALPCFVPPNATELNRSSAERMELQGGPHEVMTWFQRVVRVREGAARLDAALLYAEALAGDGLKVTARDLFTVRQLPYKQNERWAGLPGDLAGSRLSLVLHAPTELDLTKPITGLLIDEWVEVVPSKEETTGLTFHYDAPQSRAPQAILLAVAPDERTEWDLDTLEATVLETLELAKLRTIDLTALAPDIGQFLPALYFPQSRTPQP